MNISRPTLHIEIWQDDSSKLTKEEVISQVDQFLRNEGTVTADTSFSKTDLMPQLCEHLNEIKICELEFFADRKCIDFKDVSAVYHVYHLDGGGPATEEMGGQEYEDIPAATHWLLPSTDFHNLWDTLIYDTEIKEQLLKFVSTTLLFSDKGVDSNVIAWNRVLLLHGPPGTGKTSLCKALAQKLSIRLSHRYTYSQLFEVNSHSLFSKWFSESGKLVQKLFSKITELVEDPNSLVCVLIDEVESLTRTRAATSNGSDPSDALRVVNALLTQLDQIKRYPNVLILTTSNITGTIDLAFVDRADIKQYIGLPSSSAIYQIYLSCVMELRKRGIITSKEKFLTLRQLQLTNMPEMVSKLSFFLWRVAEKSEGLSGRSLRKIPFLAHALHLQKPSVPTIEFIHAMEEAVEKHQRDAAQLTSASSTS